MTYLGGTANVNILIIASVLTTIVRSIFQPSFQTAIPRIVDAEKLTKTNSIAQIAEKVASVAGSSVCSLILLCADKSWVFLFDALTYFF